jgi:glutathione S-transferase
MIKIVDLDTAKSADGLRLVLLKGVPSPWSQAVRAIVELKAIDAYGVYMRAGDAAIAGWTGIGNAPVAMFADENPYSGWAEILMLCERLAPARPLIPRNVEDRSLMLGFCHELMSQAGLVWNARLLLVETSLSTQGGEGFPMPIAQHLGARYGYRPGCAHDAKEQMVAAVAALDRLLQRNRNADRDYYLGSGPTALDIYSMASIDLLLPLPGDQCPMHPRMRTALESRRGEMEALVPTSLKEHRDFMHRMHVPLPIEI